jgi:hypothetical protein
LPQFSFDRAYPRAICDVKIKMNSSPKRCVEGSFRQALSDISHR